MTHPTITEHTYHGVTAFRITKTHTVNKTVAVYVLEIQTEDGTAEHSLFTPYHLAEETYGSYKGSKVLSSTTTHGVEEIYTYEQAEKLSDGSTVYNIDVLLKSVSIRYTLFIKEV